MKPLLPYLARTPKHNLSLSMPNDLSLCVAQPKSVSIVRPCVHNTSSTLSIQQALFARGNSMNVRESGTFEKESYVRNQFMVRLVAG